MLKCLEALLMGASALTRVFHPSLSDPLPSTGLQQSSKFLSDTTIEWIHDLQERYKIPGLGVGLIASPKLPDAEWDTELLNFGQRDHEGHPYDPDTLVKVSYNAKQFTAVAVGLLIWQGTPLPKSDQILSYQTKIKDVLPDWELQDKYMEEHLNVLDLLSMRSGLPWHYLSHRAENATEQIKHLKELRPSSEIREEWQYNDHHYWVLAEIVKHVSDSSFIDYVQKNIFDPLHMTSTTFNDSAMDASDNKAGFFFRTGFDNVKCREVWDRTHTVDPICVGQPEAIKWFLESEAERDFFTGAAGLTSNFVDMAKWVRELLDPQVLPKKVIDQIFARIIPAFDLQVDEMSVFEYGHAMTTVNYRGHEVHMQPGIQPGVANMIATVPALGVGFWVATNEGVVGAPLNDILLWRMLDDLFDLEPIAWEARLITPWLIPNRFDDVPSDLEVSPGELRSSWEPLTPHKLPIPYVATMSNLYCRGMLLIHLDGPMFEAPWFVVRTRLDGTAIPLLPNRGVMVFVEGKGVGLFGGFWGEGGDKWAVEEHVAEEAEVWFEKID